MEGFTVLFTVWICVIPLVTCTSVTRGGSKQNLTCYTCSYQQPPTADYECVNSPGEVKTARTVHCPAGRLCVVREVLNTVTGVITSFNRDCQVAPVESECDPSGQTRVCTYSCTTNLCNSQLGGEVQAAVKAQANQGSQKGPSNKASLAAPNWITYTTTVILQLLLSLHTAHGTVVRSE